MAYRPGMAFEPRSKVAQPSAFGRVAVNLQPAQGVEKDDILFQAALMQHQLAYVINEQLRMREKKLTPFMEGIPYVPGLSADRQLRILRGETSATYADLVFWAGRFPRVADVIGKYIQGLAKRVSTAADVDSPSE